MVRTTAHDVGGEGTTENRTVWRSLAVSREGKYVVCRKVRWANTQQEGGSENVGLAKWNPERNQG